MNSNESCDTEEDIKLQASSSTCDVSLAVPSKGNLEEQRSSEDEITSVLNILQKKIELIEPHDKVNTLISPESLSKKNPKESNRLPDLKTELNKLQMKNRELKKDLKKSDDKMVDFASNIENAREELTQKSLEHFRKEHESFPTTSFSSPISEPFMSLPAVDSRSETSELLGRLRFLEKRLSELEDNINEHKNYNLQLQKHNKDQKGKQLKLHETETKMKLKIEQLYHQLDPNSSASIRFSPAHKRQIDEYCQGLREQANNLKRSRDEKVHEAQASITNARRLLEEKERRVAMFQQQIQQLERDSEARNSQIEEVKTALVVATRISPQSLYARNQATIDGLRNSIRQNEANVQQATRDLENIRAENRRLNEELRQSQISPNQRAIRQTIVSHLPGGGSSRIEQTNRSMTFTNEGSTISQQSYNDIESE